MNTLGAKHDFFDEVRREREGLHAGAQDNVLSMNDATATRWSTARRRRGEGRVDHRRKGDRRGRNRVGREGGRDPARGSRMTLWRERRDAINDRILAIMSTAPMTCWCEAVGRCLYEMMVSVMGTPSTIRFSRSTRNA